MAIHDYPLRGACLLDTAATTEANFAISDSRASGLKASAKSDATSGSCCFSHPKLTLGPARR